MKFSTFILIATLTVSVFARAQSLEASEDLFDQEYILEEISCSGNTKTKCSLIKRELTVRPGKAIKDKDLQNSKIKLQLLGIFENVELNLEKGSEQGRVTLDIHVEEGSSIYTVFGADVGSVNGEDGAGDAFRTDLQFTLGTRNLFGLGKRLSGTAYTRDGGGFLGDDSSGSYSLRYTDPNILGSKRFFYNFDYVYGRKQFDRSGTYRFVDNDTNTGSNFIFFPDIDREYIDEGHLAQLELGYRVSNFSFFTLGYSVVINKRFYTEIEQGQRTKGKFHNTNNYLVFGFGVNTQDDLYFPTSGTRFEIKLPMAVGHRRKNLGGHSSIGGISSSEVYPGELDWRTTWQLKSKWFMTGFIEGRSYLDTDELINNGLGLEFAHQTRRNQTYKDVSDLRFFVTPSVATLGSFDTYGPQIAAGVKVRSKKYGMARFQIFAREDR